MPLPQVDRLEGLLRWHPEVPRCRQESAYVLHALERHLAVVDLLDDARLDGVHQTAEEGAVLEDLIEVVHVAGRVEVLLGDPADPLEDFLGQVFAVFGIHLEESAGLLVVAVSHARCGGATCTF